MKRSRLILVVALLSVTTAPIAAQRKTADGVDAFVRGDYQRAFEILQPLTESPWAADHVAEFFVGALYENGLGVPADPLRACSFYHRAASVQTTAVGSHVSGLLRPLWQSMGNDWFSNCQLLGNIGFDNGFQPVVFTLEPGHWISWDLKGATITYGGRETRIDRPLAVGGMGRTVFLPLGHIELAVGPSRSMRRHFVEIFTWTASRQANTWSLHWSLVEVVRDTLENVVQDDVLTLTAEKPPTSPPFDVRDVVRLDVTDAGDAEWIIASGPRARRDIVESDAERQAIRAERARARAAEAEANARFDSTLRRDVHRTPELVYGDVNGCGNVFLHGWSADRTEAITVRADRTPLQLGTTTREFDAAVPRNDLEVLVHVYERALRSGPFCTDVGMPPVPEESWRLTGGIVRIELSPPGIRRREPHLYQATIHLVGAEFTSPSGARVRQTRPITLTAVVGFFVG